MSGSDGVFGDHRWLEDFTLGDKYRYGSWQITRQQMLDFANLYDPEPFHTDDEAARAMGWREIIASGPQIAALWRRMSKDAFPQAEVVISPGWEKIAWLMPVYADDVLSVESEVVEARAFSSRPGQGLVKFYTRIWRGEDLVSEITATWFMRRNPEQSQ